MRQVLISMHDDAHAQIHHFVTQANAAQSQVRFRHVLLPDDEKAALHAGVVDADSGCAVANALRQRYKLAADDCLYVVLTGNLRDEKDDEYFIVLGPEHCPPGESITNVSLISLFYLRPESFFMRKGADWWRTLADVERVGFEADSILLLLLFVIANDLAGIKAHEDCRGCVMDYCQSPSEIVVALTAGFRFCDEACLPALRQHPLGQCVIDIATRLTTHPYRFVQLRRGGFDVFLSHNAADKAAVRAINQRLKQRGIVPWLDEEQVQPGRNWVKLLENQLQSINSMAVFIGPSGMGRWHSAEEETAMILCQDRNIPVIPVLLTDARESEVPPLLRRLHYVDFRKTDPDPLQQLIWGITGSLRMAV